VGADQRETRSAENPTTEAEVQIESQSFEAPDSAQVHVPAWRAWLSQLGSNLRITVSRPEVREEAESEAEGLSNAQDFNPLPVEPNPEPQSSEGIFAEVGRRLRERREMLSLTHDEVERHTHVRDVFLKALEDGALDELPSPVQTRGILANYAGFLDLDVDAVLLRFADGLQARYRERSGERPARSRGPMKVNTSLPPLRSFIASDLLFGGGVAIMLVLFAIWGISRVMSVRSTIRPQATAPSISDVLAETPIATLAQEVTLIPAEDTSLAPTQEITATIQAPTLSAKVAVQLNLVAVERTYLRVSVDGKVQFDGRVLPGTTYPFEAGDRIEVLVGNAAAIKVTYNERDLGLMGNFGEVIDRVYTAQGIGTPTATQPPTPTPTPYMTPTPSQTPTRTPSVTPTPMPGE
jgi:cytoskeletal protein RodZ